MLHHQGLRRRAGALAAALAAAALAGPTPAAAAGAGNGPRLAQADDSGGLFCELFGWFCPDTPGGGAPGPPPPPAPAPPPPPPPSSAFGPGPAAPGGPEEFRMERGPHLGVPTPPTPEATRGFTPTPLPARPLVPLTPIAPTSPSRGYWAVPFDAGGIEPNPQGRAVITAAAARAAEVSAAQVLVVGHIDVSQPRETARRLASLRAKAVAEALQAAGVPAAALTVSLGGGPEGPTPGGGGVSIAIP